MTDYTPIKTEYKGIVFDSKSEAVFARTLDLAFIEWFYHPCQCLPSYVDATTANYTDEMTYHPWDFLIITPDMTRFFVEYKPSMPTLTYIKNLTNKCKKTFEHRDCNGRLQSIIVWGNPWEGSKDKFFSDCSYVAYPVYCIFQGDYGWGDFSAIADYGGDGTELFSYKHPIKEMFNITEKIVQEAKGYRFDLQH